MGDQRGFFQFEIILNVLVSYFRFILIPIYYGSAAIINVGECLLFAELCLVTQTAGPNKYCASCPIVSCQYIK